METGMLGNFLSCLKCVKVPLSLKWEGGISHETPQWKRASSRVRRRISWFFSSCSMKLWVPLELRRGHQGPAHVTSGMSSLHPSCEGPVGIPLQSLMGWRSSSGVEAGSSGFLSSADMNLGVPLEFPQGSQTSSHLEASKCALLLRWKRSVRLLGIGGFLSRCHRAVTHPMVF